MDEESCDRKGRSTFSTPALGDAQGSGKRRAVWRPRRGERRLKIKLIFIFWANDDAMFSPAPRVCVKINSNQLLVEIAGRRAGHITGPELPHCGANKAINC
jgi:hypothetical protein